MTDRSLMRPVPFPAGVSRPIVSPLQASVVYASPDPDSLDDQYEGRTQGYTYAREGHPNADVLATRLDALENASGGVVVGSGMAAVSAALLGLLKAGDHVIGADQLYGRSLRMMNEDLPRLGIDVTLVDPTDAQAVSAEIRPTTRMILIETVSNPTLRVADLDGIAALTIGTDILLAVDNTFTTPALLKPLARGADIVIHSVTKLLAGHSDATLGYIAAKDPDIAIRLSVFAATVGLTPSPFDCWLAERGLMTFNLRLERAEKTATLLADMLGELPGVGRVLYPNRPDHPDHNRAIGLLGGRGGNMVSFEVEGTREAANRLVRAAEGIAFAPTLGDVGTTLSHPASSSHRALTPQGRDALGISEGFFRVSVGCEDPEALLDVFRRAVLAV